MWAYHQFTSDIATQSEYGTLGGGQKNYHANLIVFGSEPPISPITSLCEVTSCLPHRLWVEPSQGIFEKVRKGRYQ
jgi:hypothetical protein